MKKINKAHNRNVYEHNYIIISNDIILQDDIIIKNP